MGNVSFGTSTLAKQWLWMEWTPRWILVWIPGWFCQLLDKLPAQYRSCGSCQLFPITLPLCALGNVNSLPKHTFMPTCHGSWWNVEWFGLSQMMLFALRSSHRWHIVGRQLNGSPLKSSCSRKDGSTKSMVLSLLQPFWMFSFVTLSQVNHRLCTRFQMLIVTWMKMKLHGLIFPRLITMEVMLALMQVFVRWFLMEMHLRLSSWILLLAPHCKSSCWHTRSWLELPPSSSALMLLAKVCRFRTVWQ